MTQTALYRHFDASGRLLYVGISLSAVQRLAQHASSDWSADIRRVDVEVYPTRDAALAAEAVAIRDERPEHNRRPRQHIAHLSMDNEPDILELRRAKGWTQEQLAEHLGIDRSTVSRLENGMQRPRGALRKLIAQIAAVDDSKGGAAA